jgi:ATP/maltotriose-dependent transcriptional regulator MalT
MRAKRNAVILFDLPPQVVELWKEQWHNQDTEVSTATSWSQAESLSRDALLITTLQQLEELHILDIRRLKKRGTEVVVALSVDQAERMADILQMQVGAAFLESSDCLPFIDPLKLRYGKGGLTARERQVLQLATYGCTNLAIALLLGLNVDTVKTYKYQPTRSLRVYGWRAAAEAAVQRGLIDAP